MRGVENNKKNGKGSRLPETKFAYPVRNVTAEWSSRTAPEGSSPRGLLSLRVVRDVLVVSPTERRRHRACLFCFRYRIRGSGSKSLSSLECATTSKQPGPGGGDTCAWPGRRAPSAVCRACLFRSGLPRFSFSGLPRSFVPRTVLATTPHSKPSAALTVSAPRPFEDVRVI